MASLALAESVAPMFLPSSGPSFPLCLARGPRASALTNGTFPDVL